MSFSKTVKIFTFLNLIIVLIYEYFEMMMLMIDTVNESYKLMTTVYFYASIRCIIFYAEVYDFRQESFTYF